MSLIDNQQYFINTKFIRSIFDLKQLPGKTSLLKEVAIAGRSNCGKSSIINSLTNNPKLAITSKTPGRTQAINYFQINNDQYLVDLPGYGYAKVPNQVKLFWGNLLQEYLISRSSLNCIILIMDIRHPFKDPDLKMLDFCYDLKLPVHIVLNKADQLSKQQIEKTLNISYQQIKHYPSISIQTCSTIKSIGISELQQKIIEFLNSNSVMF